MISSGIKVTFSGFNRLYANLYVRALLYSEIILGGAKNLKSCD